ncbi:MAG: anthranilate synthase component II [Bacteroidales bacterium]
MNILLLDNYDSFSYNLVNILRKFRKHRLSILQPHEVNPEELGVFDKMIFSPGPDIPARGDLMWQIIHRYHREKSILGICLGFHAISIYFGVQLRNVGTVVHGQTRQVSLTDPSEPLFRGIVSPFRVGLYHSWTPKTSTFPAELKPTAVSSEGLVMAHAHHIWDLRGVQFHPESVMTPEGQRMIENWLSI